MAKNGLLARGFMRLTERLDRRYRWDHLPKPLALLTLIGLRMKLRRTNLYDPEGQTLPWAPAPLPPGPRPLQRSPDGTGNDRTHQEMGSAGTRFGRNVPISDSAPIDVLEPNPRTVSLELLTREQFQPATTLNTLAAAWLQFQVHDWFSHGSNDKDNPWQVEVAADDPWPEHPMRIPRTTRDTSTLDGGPPTYRNTETHWWDASQLYGSNIDLQHLIRTHVGGKLVLSPEGLVPFDPTTMRNLAGVSGNWWIGLAMLHTLFMKEHNAICDRLARAYPRWGDDDLFEHARLVNAALIAKIHTVEWTPALLGDPIMQTGMRVNWWGFMGERFARRFGRIAKAEEVSGIPGSETHHHGVPYAMTEEFVAVYRMHPLIPDEYRLRALQDDALIEERTFDLIAGTHTHEVLQSVAMPDLFYSFGTSNPGAIALHNFPKFLQLFQKSDGTILDLAATDILRSRERGVPRYNEFRRKFHLAPATTFEDFSDDPNVVSDLRRIYRDPEAVDLMIGLYAEKPPQGFAFSDTAFRVFILMASRRLKSDRFFTYDYRPEVYTSEGLQWIADNTMGSVLLRHYPALAPALRGSENAFAPWTVAVTH
ncbi:MAG TPA: peroxidase family protein [Acidimicrobiales bacterium]|nr:peroxidase family protein [Acidimicrobiales bacterium]